MTPGGTTPDPSFWAGKRVFLTGHTGFKGSWLSAWLLRLGARVSGFALAPVGDPALFDLLGLADRVDHRIGDVRSLPELTEAMGAAEPEIVIHMAAQPLVRESYRDPVGTYATNVMGTVHLLEAARTVPTVRAVLIVTSDKCYENREWTWGYRELDPLGGRDPYSSSKAAAEHVTHAYRSSFFEAAGGRGAVVGSARAGNVIGGGDWTDDRLVPDMVRAFASGEAAIVRHPNATRPWQHVLEPLRGYLAWCEYAYTEPQRAATAFNFGPAEADVVSVRELADAFCAAWGDGASWRADEARRDLHEATELRLDWSRARTMLGWRPRLDLTAAIDHTVAAYRAFYDGGADALSTVVDQQLEVAGRPR